MTPNAFALALRGHIYRRPRGLIVAYPLRDSIVEILLGLLASQARRVSDAMMMAAAKTLGGQSPALQNAAASLLPSIRNIREVALEIAYAVALKAQQEGLAPACQPEALRREVVESQWTTKYMSYQP